jgi:hypothetical protein
MEVQCFKFFSWPAYTSEVLQAMQPQIMHFLFLIMFVILLYLYLSQSEWNIFSYSSLEKV